MHLGYCAIGLTWDTQIYMYGMEIYVFIYYLLKRPSNLILEIAIFSSAVYFSSRAIPSPLTSKSDILLYLLPSVSILLLPMGTFVVHYSSPEQRYSALCFLCGLRGPLHQLLCPTHFANVSFLKGRNGTRTAGQQQKGTA